MDDDEVGALFRALVLDPDLGLEEVGEAMRAEFHRHLTRGIEGTEGIADEAA